MYKEKKYDKLINYLNQYKNSDKFPLIYNGLLLKLSVTEQLEFGRIFQVYTSKKDECKNQNSANNIKKLIVELVNKKKNYI